MDMEKELAKILINGKDADEIVTNIAIEQDRLNKMSHIFKTISLANKIEKFLEEGKFSERNLKYLEIDYLYTRDKGQINFWLEDENNGAIGNGVMHLVRDAFNCIDGFNHDFVNDDFAGKEQRLDLIEGIGEKILDLFLSDELKKIYEYNKMKLDLPKNNNQHKKIKM